MFKRKKPLTVLQQLKELFWPSMGWIRACKYTKHRIMRLSDSSHKIAFGLALGIAISFTPLLGTHFIQVGILAYIFRANLIAALIGTFAGNPWTFPFMWWAAVTFGAYLFELIGLPASTSIPEEMDFAILWELIKNEPLRLFLPWALGGYLLGILTIPASYAVFYQLVKGAKIARKKARTRNLHKVAKQITGQKT